MNFWQSLDHAADMASLYGISQRQSILSAQQHSLTEQRHIAALQQEQLKVEKARLSADEADRHETRKKVEVQKRARQLFCLLEERFSTLEARFDPTSENIVDLALIEKHLEVLAKTDVFESLEDLRALTTLTRKLDSFVSVLRTQRILTDAPSSLLQTHLPALNRILQQAASICWDRLVIHPQYQAALRSDQAKLKNTAVECEKRISQLTNRLNANLNFLAELGIDGTDFATMRSTYERFGHSLTDGELLTGRKVNNASALIEQRMALWEEVPKLAKSVEQAREDESRLFDKYNLHGCVSQWDDRRKELFKTENTTAFLGVEVADSLERVRQMMNSLDGELVRLRASVPPLCLSANGTAINKACGAFASLMSTDTQTGADIYTTDVYLYEVLSQEGRLYDSVKAELSDIQTYLTSLMTQYEQQCTVLKEVNKELDALNVLSARKKLRTLKRTFNIDYGSFDAAVDTAMKPYSQAVNLLEEARKHAQSQKTLVGRLFRKTSKESEIYAGLAALKRSMSALEACELKSEVLKLVASAEKTLFVSS